MYYRQDAFFRGQGWIPVMGEYISITSFLISLLRYFRADERSPQTLGRAGDPDDYLGMVLVEGGGKVKLPFYFSYYYFTHIIHRLIQTLMKLHQLIDWLHVIMVL